MADNKLTAANTFQAAGSTRKRVIYQSEALFAGQNGTQNIQRVQSANYSFTVPRVDVNQYGQLGQIERLIVEVPTVSLDFSYSLAGTTNEQILFGSTSADASGSKGIMFNVNSDTNIEKQTIFFQKFRMITDPLSTNPPSSSPAACRRRLFARSGAIIRPR